MKSPMRPRGPQPPRSLAHRARASCGTLALIASMALPASGCGGGGGTGTGGGSTSPFHEVALTPADGAQGVATSVKVQVRFSLPVAPASIASDAVRVGVVDSGEVPGVTALVADGTGKVIEFTPTSLLDAGMTHTVLLSPALRSSTGDMLGGSTSFSFRTLGGTGGPPVLPPASALRRATGSLNVGRRNHTATRLANGHVLFCGGYTRGTTISDRAEIFDPTSEAFTQVTAHMRQPRAGHTATRLTDGRVLLAGGWYEVSAGTLNVATTAEIFDPVLGTFTDVGNLGIARADHAALRLPDGRVLATGGSLLAGDQLIDHDSVEVFDPTAGTWSPWPLPMSHTRSTHGLIDLLDGRWLLVGGSDVDLRPETFDTTTGVFTPFSAAIGDHARFGAATARYASGNVAVIGGESFGDVLHFDRTLTYLRNSGSPTSLPRAYGTATLIAPDRVLVAGGLDFSSGSLLLATCDVVVEGGPSGSLTYGTSVRFPTGMVDHTATLLLDGRVLFAGGLNATGGQPELSAAYLFTP